MNIFSSPLFNIITLVADILVIIFVFSYFLSKNRSNNEGKNEVNNTGAGNFVTFTDVNRAESSDGLSSEVVAVITAAVMAYMQGNGTGLRVRSIKRIGQTAPVWNAAGRNEYIMTRL